MIENSAPQEPKKKDDSIVLWMGIGGLLLIFIVVIGFVVLNRLASSRNTLVNETQPTTAPREAHISAGQPALNYAPVFESAPCQIKPPDGIKVTCGYVEVPEDRNGDLSDTIRIATAVFHSISSTPESDPVLYLQGGPGDKAIEWSIKNYANVIAPLLAERDFIVFDPRGVGYSEPTLDCDEFRITYLQDIQGRLPADQKISYYQGALLGCRNSLQKVGANLSVYTSPDTAADAKDILIGLGYQQANLYGISYGTRIAQFMMRDYPEIVRSAILDSVVPIEAQLLNQSSSEQDHALHVLFEACESDPACASAYPDLEATYNEVVDRLNAQPLTLIFPINESARLEQVVDGHTFRDTILWALRMQPTIALVPQIIQRSRDGDYSTLMLSLALPILSFDSISMGTYISVNCHDQVFAMATDKLENTIFEMCKLWDAKPPAPGENDPVISEIPTLIFAGKYDPVTPPSFAYQLSGNLAHSYVAEIPDQGHTPSVSGVSDCTAGLISDFLKDPDISPEFDCIQDLQAIKFVVPYDPSVPLLLETARIEEYQITTRVPVGWGKAEFGFYNRNGSFGDITQIGIQSAPVTQSDWLTWLLSNFSASQGFDQPAVNFGQRQANGLTWTIYTTSYLGNPVDIALASTSNQTLMVLLACYRDEHDALYNKVFLPIIDSTKTSN